MQLNYLERVSELIKHSNAFAFIRCMLEYLQKIAIHVYMYTV